MLSLILLVLSLLLFKVNLELRKGRIVEANPLWNKLSFKWYPISLFINVVLNLYLEYLGIWQMPLFCCLLIWTALVNDYAIYRQVKEDKA